MSLRRLVADAGGTNVRFAFADSSGGLERLRTYRTENFSTFVDALAAYLTDAGVPQDIAMCTIAAAGPVDNDFVKLTNNAWSINCIEVSALMAGIPVALVNDLEAVAAALPHLMVDDLKPLGGPASMRPETHTMLALNIGTGFGAASAVRHGGQWWTCPSEPGHMTLGVATADEIALLPIGASVESLVSGEGVTELYKRLAGVDRRTIGRSDDAASVFARAGRDRAAARTVDLLTTVIGRIAGDLALATGAWGGVHLCGSVAVGWSAVADVERFRAEFTRKGPMSARMQQVPTAVICRENISLFGLAMVPVSH